MNVAAEQFASANKANVETLLTIANTAFASAERLAALNLNTARAVLDVQGLGKHVTLPGGELTIEWRAEDDHVLMTGPAAFEFEGHFDPALFSNVA